MMKIKAYAHVFCNVPVTLSQEWLLYTTGTLELQACTGEEFLTVFLDGQKCLMLTMLDSRNLKGCNDAG